MKQDFFFKDFIYGTTITGSWIDEVGEFVKCWRKTILHCSLFVWPVAIVLLLLRVMKVKNDHRSKFSNLSIWKEEA